MGNLSTSKKWWLTILFAIVVYSMGVQILVGVGLHKSALLYIGLPLLVSVILILLKNDSPYKSAGRKYWTYTLNGLIIVIASAILLGEGFICVAFLLPIYLIILLMMFIAEILYKNAKDKHSLKAHILPLVLLVISMEGISPVVSFERKETAYAEAVIDHTTLDLNELLLKPMDLDQDRSWFLSIFPMPYLIDNRGNEVGDVHKIKLRYHRWFVTNTHEGEMNLRIVEISPTHLKTKFDSDTSYFANYLHLIGTEIRFKKMSDDKTKVSLHIDYERMLDPAWYFSPLMKFGVEQAAEFLLNEVVVRHEG